MDYQLVKHEAKMRFYKIENRERNDIGRHQSLRISSEIAGEVGPMAIKSNMRVIAFAQVETRLSSTPFCRDTPERSPIGH